MTLHEFDRFLETSGPGGDLTAKRLRLSRDDVAELQSAYAALVRLGTAKARILADIGRPHVSDVSRVCYALPSKPDHYFAFTFDALDQLVGSGYVSRMGRSCPGILSPRVVKALRTMGATEEEVRTWYGEPDSVIGWWPIETWTYGPVHFDLRLGIVI
jgi:hypothetical protein